MDELAKEVVPVAAETGFSGVVRVDRGDVTEVAVAYGEAHRGWDIANTVETRSGVASAGKGLTALAVATFVEDGTLQWTTTARSLLGTPHTLTSDELVPRPAKA